MEHLWETAYFMPKFQNFNQLIQQVRNQESFRAVKFSENKGTLINI